MAGNPAHGNERCCSLACPMVIIFVGGYLTTNHLTSFLSLNLFSMLYGIVWETMAQSYREPVSPRRAIPGPWEYLQSLLTCFARDVS